MGLLRVLKRVLHAWLCSEMKYYLYPSKKVYERGRVAHVYATALVYLNNVVAVCA